MNNKGILLLRTLLLSTSQRNILKYTTDKKKKKKIIGNYIGTSVLYLLIMSYSILMCIGYGTVGLIDSAPVMCALIISTLAFVFTLFKTNGYLFNFKEYDMLMSLPFETRHIAACKFMYMYVQSMPWYLSISVAMLVGYAAYAHPGILIYPLWLILTCFLPIIPMLFAAFLGFLIARVSSGFKKNNIIQTVLTFILVIFLFSLRFILENIFRNNKVEATLEQASEITADAAKIYMPAGWFTDAITKGSISSVMLLAGVSILLFVILFRIVGKSYRNINSAMRSHAAAKNYKMTVQKRSSAVWAIAFKEFKRLTGSTVYMVNAAMGEVLVVILGIVTLIIGFDKLIAMITQNAPVDTAILRPGIPFILYFFTGMVATTACSPSLEGKNYWIMQSLPLDKKTIYHGKMLFNMCLTVPVMVFSTLCMCISAKVSLFETILYLVLGFALCAFSTAWGCVCGVKHMRLDWENEVEVIKQGAAVTLYMLPNMFVTMGLVVLVVFLGTIMNHVLLMILFILIASVIAVLSYLRVMALAKR